MLLVRETPCYHVIFDSCNRHGKSAKKKDFYQASDRPITCLKRVALKVEVTGKLSKFCSMRNTKSFLKTIFLLTLLKVTSATNSFLL